MVRDFSDRPVADEALERILDAGRRAPSAGFAQGFEFLVLQGTGETNRYWDVALPDAERAGFRFPGLLRAPVLIVPCANPQAYLDRYSEPDKVAAGFGASRDAWPVPYWTVDTAFAAMAMLYAAVDEGLGALFFGLPGDGGAIKAEFGIPPDREPIGVIAIGWPAAGEAPSGSSVRRPRKPAHDVVHRREW